MLQKLREKASGWMGISIMGVAVFVFSFFGIESYFSTRTDTFAAKVGDQEIAQHDFQTQMNQLRQRAQRSNPDVDQAMFSSPKYKRRVLDGMINRTLLRQANNDLGIVVTKRMIADEIGTIPAFQINGKFDADTYKAVLGQQGLTPIGFQQRVREDLSTQVLPKAIAATALAPQSEVDAYLRLRGQSRDVRYVELPKPVLKNTEVSSADIKAYYDAHTDQFVTPEQVTLHYIEVKAEAMQADAEPTDAALRAQYEREKAKFTTPEQRKVSHILVSVPDNATPAQQKAALTKAEKIEQQLHDGADFAALAKQESDDLGSKRQGGDLGWIEKGVTDPAFESALFAMSKGQVSQPVLSSEGYHIIWLHGVRGGKTQPLAAVKDQLSKELLGSDREAKYRDVASKLTDMIYANPGSLRPAAEKLGLKVQTTQPFSRDGGPGIAANPALVKVAFSDQVLKEDMTSDPVSMDTNDMVVVHLASHKAKSRKPLASVTPQIRKRILDARDSKAARDHAEAMLAKLNHGESLEAVADAEKAKVQSSEKLTRMSTSVPKPLREKIFKMPHPAPKAPSRTLVDMGKGQYALVVLSAVHPGDPDTVPVSQQKAIAVQLQRLHADAEQRGIIDVLRRHTTITYPKSSGAANKQI